MPLGQVNYQTENETGQGKPGEWTHIKASSLSSKRVVGHVWDAEKVEDKEYGGGKGGGKVLIDQCG